MKKLKAILSGANFIDRLFDLRERDVKRSLESASDDAERQMTEAEIRYEELCKKLGEKEVNYTTTINQMLEQKDIIRRAKETIEAVKAIKDDLESEVELKEEDKKKKITGSPGRRATRLLSSVGRASVLYSEGHPFEPDSRLKK